MADEVIEGYRLAKHMATGQSSQVWEVVELTSHRHFAMKLLLPEKSDKGEFRRVLFHEAEVGSKTDAPQHHQDRQGHPTCEKSGLRHGVFPRRQSQGPVGREADADFLREKLHDLLKQAATALAFTNAKGWVHRDVKPDNILANSAGELRLIDFALATRIQKPSLFGRLFGKKRQTMGTRSYMSPEQIRGAALDGRADVYSFGATCYELVTGRPPFRGASSQELLDKHIREARFPACPQSRCHRGVFRPGAADAGQEA